MIRLIDPDVRYHASWLGAAAEFAAAGEYQHGSGLTPDHFADEQVRGGVYRPSWLAEDGAHPQRFAEFVTAMIARRDRAVAERLGLVPDTKLWIVQREAAEEHQFVGSLSLRHQLNDWLLRKGGHIGYSVRPSSRRRGIATEALRLALLQARGLGLSQVLLTCENDNAASAAIIERAGGVLENVLSGKRRYWITLD